MATVNFSVPDDVKDAFNAAFEGQNKSAIIAGLMREAVERARRREEHREAALRILTDRSTAPRVTQARFSRARKAGRP